MSVNRVAIIDSDSGFVKVLTKRLEGAGWEYRIFPGGAPAEDLAAMKLNAILLDPAETNGGWELLEEVCGMLPELGMIVCSGPSTVAQRVRGLRLGADDWVSKPCHPEEVMARLEAIVRRRRRSARRADAGPLVAGELEIRPDQYQAFVAGESIGLTRREFELLHVLSDAEGKVIEREDIYQRVWGYAMAHGDRSVDVFVRKLRQKIQRYSPGWGYIHTHFGVGYRFQPEPVTPEEEPQAPTERISAARAEARGEPANAEAAVDAEPAPVNRK